jgi:4-hydroxy-tetrahydrodipicolinate synthase
MTKTLAGVFPIVPTPFDEQGRAHEADLARVTDWIIRMGADGIVFPGVASEFDTLKHDERMNLVQAVAKANAGRVPFVVGASSDRAEASLEYASQARRLGAAGLMAMNPAALRGDDAAIERYYRDLGAQGVPIILQNAPAPIGSALPVETIAALVDAIPMVRYVKEETMPCGQRIAQLLARRPKNLAGVFGGAGGRYITDELARGACGTMPAAELTDLHARMFAAHRAGDRRAVRALFNRMLPLLNFQAVFRMAMTKEVLRRRGVISAVNVRAAGPRLDAGDRIELDEMLAEIAPELRS